MADRAIAIKGLDVDRHVRERIDVRTRDDLVRMAACGKVRKIVDWPETWWELGRERKVCLIDLSADIDR